MKGWRRFLELALIVQKVKVLAAIGVPNARAGSARVKGRLSSAAKQSLNTDGATDSSGIDGADDNRLSNFPFQSFCASGRHAPGLFGDTKDFADEEGESTDDLQFVVGVRAWF